jgi:hypothetical protein
MMKAVMIIPKCLGLNQIMIEEIIILIIITTTMYVSGEGYLYSNSNPLHV